MMMMMATVSSPQSQTLIKSNALQRFGNLSASRFFHGSNKIAGNRIFFSTGRKLSHRKILYEDLHRPLEVSWRNWATSTITKKTCDSRVRFGSAVRFRNIRKIVILEKISIWFYSGAKDAIKKASRGRSASSRNTEYVRNNASACYFAKL